MKLLIQLVGGLVFGVGCAGFDASAGLDGHGVPSSLNKFFDRLRRGSDARLVRSRFSRNAELHCVFLMRCIP